MNGVEFIEGVQKISVFQQSVKHVQNTNIHYNKRGDKEAQRTIEALKFCNIERSIHNSVMAPD